MSRPASANFRFYDALRTFEPATVREAVAFSRVFTDLAQRCLAAQAAQRGWEVVYPELIGLPALHAFGAGPSEHFRDRFKSHTPADWAPGALELLADLAEWLAQGYSASDPRTGSVQVWVGQPGDERITMAGSTPRPEPPAPFRWTSEPPLADWLRRHSDKPAAIIAHYDTHGLTMLALTLRYLRRLGFAQIDPALSFEWTGDISKLWKRAVPKTLQHESEYAVVVMVDCPIHSRTPEYTQKALGRVQTERDQRLVIIDHHADTFTMAPQLLQPGVEVALTDILSCGLTDTWEDYEHELMVVGALSDKVPEVFYAYPVVEHPRLHAATDELGRRCLQFSPTPPAMKDAGIYPLRPLWDALADGEPLSAELATRTLGELPPLVEPPLPEYSLVGNVAVVTERLTAMGRAWYSLLERVMDDAGVPYSIAVRLLNGRHANFLLLTQWQRVEAPPVRMFVPADYLPRCLGHSTAVWCDLPKEHASEFIGVVLEGINAYWGTETDAQVALEGIQRNILDQLPVDLEERAAQNASMLGKPN